MDVIRLWHLCTAGWWFHWQALVIRLHVIATSWHTHNGWRGYYTRTQLRIAQSCSRAIACWKCVDWSYLQEVLDTESSACLSTIPSTTTTAARTEQCSSAQRMLLTACWVSSKRCRSVSPMEELPQWFATTKKRSLDVRAHLRRFWRCSVKTLALPLVFQ